MKLAVFTSITNSYFAKARVLAQSVKEHQPNSYFVLALLDRPPCDLREIEPSIDEVFQIEEKDFPDFLPWIYEHDVVEACTAQKGYVLQQLLRRGDFDAVVYLDPDTRLFSRLVELEDALSQASTVITPHLTQPSQSRRGVLDNEFAALQHGSFNLGFLAVKADRSGLAVANWWDERLRSFCFDEKSKGIFTDQKWFDLVPGLFDSVQVLRHPGYNIATWNLENRFVDRTSEGYEVNGLPIRFIHFSGYDSGSHHAMLEAYAGDQPIFKALSHEYETLLRMLSTPLVDELEWCFRRNRRGEVIKREWRRAYRDNVHLRKRTSDPFLLSEGDFAETASAEKLSQLVDHAGITLEMVALRWKEFESFRISKLRTVARTPRRDETSQSQIVAWLKSLDGRTSVGFIEHGLGGGLEVHTRQLSRVMAHRANFVRMSAFRLDADFWELKLVLESTSGTGPQHVFVGNAHEIKNLISKLPIDFFHVHSMYQSEDLWLHVIANETRPVDVTIHDFTLLTNNWSMDNGRGGTFPLDLQLEILAKSYRASTRRSQIAEFLNAARRIIFPTVNAKENFEAGFGQSLGQVAYHPEYPFPELLPTLPRPRQVDSGSRLTVALIGDLASHKGANQIRQVTNLAAEKARNIHFIHFGANYPGLPQNVQNFGKVDRSRILSEIRNLQVDVVLLPNQVHETYGYVLSDAMFARLPIVASAIGAFIERTQDRSNTILLEPNVPADVWLDALASVRGSVVEVTTVNEEFQALVNTRNFYEAAYFV